MDKMDKNDINTFILNNPQIPDDEMMDEIEKRFPPELVEQWHSHMLLLLSSNDESWSNSDPPKQQLVMQQPNRAQALKDLDRVNYTQIFL